jgi:hypothetical protein
LRAPRAAGDAEGEFLGIGGVVPRSFMEQAAFGGCADDAESDRETSAPLILPNWLGIFDRTGMETAGAWGRDCKATGRQSAGEEFWQRTGKGTLEVKREKWDG